MSFRFKEILDIVVVFGVLGVLAVVPAWLAGRAVASRVAREPGELKSLKTRSLLSGSIIGLITAFTFPSVQFFGKPVPVEIALITIPLISFAAGACAIHLTTHWTKQ